MSLFLTLQETRNAASKDRPHAIEVYNTITNLEVILGLATMLPLLCTLNNLIKILQERDLFVHDAIHAVRSAHQTIAERYLSASFAFQGTSFLMFHELGKKNAQSIFTTKAQFVFRTRLNQGCFFLPPSFKS